MIYQTNPKTFFYLFKLQLSNYVNSIYQNKLLSTLN